MNRIVLIGNGFDLAHGLKTSYADFIDWYWEEWGKRLRSDTDKLVEDHFCSFQLNNSVRAAGWYLVWPYCVEMNPLRPWTNKELVAIAQQHEELCAFISKSKFFEKICEHLQTKNWVDIEDVYYAFLKSSEDPKQINDDLEFIKEKLIEYLNSLEKPSINPIIQKQILSPISQEDIAIGSMQSFYKMRMTSHSLSPTNVMLLNFNYTNTADLYLQKTDKFSVNHIHGSLSKPESVIFGYGDERDDEYEKLMKKNDNEYLRHIKSFRYLDASNYRRMLSFIESDSYQICIMGHSCGVTDRTLLSTLFGHKNCVSIKPYYHLKEDGTDNYQDLVCCIARNFSDPRLMRDRVVGKERCETLGKE